MQAVAPVTMPRQVSEGTESDALKAWPSESRITDDLATPQQTQWAFSFDTMSII